MAYPKSAYRAVTSLLLACVWSLDAGSQEYPARPVRLIVASSPGSGVDTVGRIVGQRIGDVIGVQVFVDNRPGGGGSIGVQAVAKSAPDGYTLLMVAPSFTINASLMRPPPTMWSATFRRWVVPPPGNTSSSCIHRCQSPASRN
jgi:tripartite-type tricarboxylate transporter receptor subunit TctC